MIDQGVILTMACILAVYAVAVAWYWGDWE